MMKLFGYKVTWQRKIKDDNESKENVCLENIMYLTFENNSVSVETAVVLFHIDTVSLRRYIINYFDTDSVLFLHI